MKINIHCIAILFTVSTITSAIAGGGSVSFESQGLRLLNQSPALADIFASKFVVHDRGVMGPADAPFDGRRLYTYMDFRGTSVESEKHSFLIRIHFKRTRDKMTFSRIEVFPVPTSMNVASATFKEIQDSTGANKAE